MLVFAQEVSQLVHSIGQMDTLAVKVASAEDSHLAQVTVAEASNRLYNVMQKKASEVIKGDQPRHLKVAVLVNEVATTLGKAPLSEEQNLKIASVVAVDEALTEMLKTAGVVDLKYAEARAYGREYLMEILRGIL
jgi:hypothetical protein